MLRKVPVRISFGLPMMPPVGPGAREADRAYVRGIMDAIASLKAEQERTAWK